MSSADAWFAEASRRERSRVVGDARRLVNRVGTLGESVCRKYPIGSVVAASAVGAGLAGIAGSRARHEPESGEPRSSGLLGSTLSGALQAYIVHALTACVASQRDETYVEELVTEESELV